ncbi:hypothetical protein TCON_1207 [Astathelohania contejeani]|uniref:Uncharacterized protein n=1 Tax=Astathelohania contejeani TaxID=164912 RepID=A0ABQ7HZF5_9MICR|nr:hypothetical protein TCON_1207 [Thelohania contejeani]
MNSNKHFKLSTKKVFYYSITLLLEIIIFSISLYDTDYFESVFTYLALFQGLFFGALFIIDAIINNNIYQMYLYLFIIIFNLASALVRGLFINDLYIFIGQLIFIFLISQKLFMSIIFLHFITPQAKWDYYKKLGANEKITGKLK